MTTTVHSAQGRDCSSWQSAMNLTGLDFVIVRATIGDGGLTANVVSELAALAAVEPMRGLFTASGPGAVTDGVDARFGQFWAQAAAAGIIRGAYHFFYPGQSPAAQASLFVSTVKAHGLRPGDVLVCDSETYTSDVDGRTLAFCQAVETLAGVHCPVVPYTNHDVGQHLARTAASYPDVWFAHPSGTAPDAGFIAPFKHWRFWQWGTQGGVDADAYNGTAADLAAWIGGYVKGPDMANLPGRWRQIISVTPTVAGYLLIGMGTDGALYELAYDAQTEAWGNLARISDPAVIAAS